MSFDFEELEATINVVSNNALLTQENRAMTRDVLLKTIYLACKEYSGNNQKFRNQIDNMTSVFMHKK